MWKGPHKFEWLEGWCVAEVREACSGENQNGNGFSTGRKGTEGVENLKAFNLARRRRRISPSLEGGDGGLPEGKRVLRDQLLRLGNDLGNNGILCWRLRLVGPGEFEDSPRICGDQEAIRFDEHRDRLQRL